MLNTGHQYINSIMNTNKGIKHLAEKLTTDISSVPLNEEDFYPSEDDYNNINNNYLTSEDDDDEVDCDLCEISNEEFFKKWDFLR